MIATRQHQQVEGFADKSLNSCVFFDDKHPKLTAHVVGELSDDGMLALAGLRFRQSRRSNNGGLSWCRRSYRSQVAL